MCVCLLGLNLHNMFYDLHKKLWNIVQCLVAWIVAVQEYQCSHCSKYYPSERLLRDHMRHHVNHYKCSFCDMTCPTPSSLSVHIRYRHLDSKPFKCSFCEYTWVCVHFTLRNWASWFVQCFWLVCWMCLVQILNLSLFRQMYLTLDNIHFQILSNWLFIDPSAMQCYTV